MKIETRPEWGSRGPANPGRDVSGNLPWDEVAFHTEAVVRTNPTHERERAWVRADEAYHINHHGWDGIGYSFLIGPSGRIYEGRGWGRSGAHTETRNSTAAGVCFLGHGDQQPATDAQWASARWLIGEGIRVGALRPNPKISGHRDYSRKGKTCPGNLIYPHLGRLRGITGPGTTPTPNPTTPTPDPGGFMSALTDQQQQDLYRAVMAGKDAEGYRPDRIAKRIDDIHRTVHADYRAGLIALDEDRKGRELSHQDYAAQLIAIAEAREARAEAKG